MNNKIVSLILFLCILAPLVLSSGTTMAGPAAPDIFTVYQPDGTAIKTVVKGDERQHWMETPKGHTIARDKMSRKWFYVDHYKGKSPIFTNVPADRTPPGWLKKHIKPQKKTLPAETTNNLQDINDASTSFSTSPTEELLSIQEESPSAASALLPLGSGALLFILVEFDDQPGSTSEDSWAGLLSNNIADYTYAASYGRVNISPALEAFGNGDNGVIGWLNVGANHPGSDGDVTSDEKRQLAHDAIIAADQYIDYASYDFNNDGFVDSFELAITVVVAGYEESYGGASAYSPNVWAHKWSLLDPAASVDGVTVGAYNLKKGGYAMVGETHQTSPTDGHQATMGIMIHELGHLVYGFPDLYDTDGTSSGIGAFCVMSSGNWGKSLDDTWSGQSPVLPSAWIKQNAGWVSTVTACGVKYITAAGDATATSFNTVFKIKTDNYPNDNEYFLVENRQPSGYDRGLERWLGDSFGGLAIFHIDDTQTSNSNDLQRLVDLEEADGVQMGTTRGSASNLWFAGQSANIDGFGDAFISDPNSNLYNTNPSLVSVTEISASGPVMTADLAANPNYCLPDGVLLFEDFDRESPPLGWSIVDNEGAGRIWLYESPRAVSNYTGGTGKYATADSYYYYLDGNYPKTYAMDTELVSPFFNTSSYEQLYLSFDSYWSPYNNDHLQVDINCGSGWTLLWDELSAQPTTAEHILLDISPHTFGQNQCQIRFHYLNALAYQWQVDNISVHGILSPAAYQGGTYILPANQWRMISLPRDPGGENTAYDLLVDDLLAEQYDISWILYKRDKVTDTYVPLDLNSPLEMGEGYWIHSGNEALLDLPGLPTTPLVSPECPNGCFEIPLIKASSTEGSHRYNMVGHPFAHDVPWADVRVKVISSGSSTLFTPSQASAAGYLWKDMYKYDSGWTPLDDITPGMLGTLHEFDGFLAKVLGGPIVNTYETISLLIPATISVASPVESIADTSSAFSAPTFSAPTIEVQKITNDPVIPHKDGWFIRLIAEDPSSALLDRGNVLGQLVDSKAEYDLHDLREFAPMSGNYLTIVFPHQEWLEKAGDYASDFRHLSPQKSDVWHFEVRTNDPQRQVTLSWEGLPKILRSSVLVDEKTGETIKPGANSTYSFTMNATTRAFTWYYGKKNKNK